MLGELGATPGGPLAGALGEPLARDPSVCSESQAGTPPASKAAEMTMTAANAATEASAAARRLIRRPMKGLRQLSAVRSNDWHDAEHGLKAAYDCPSCDGPRGFRPNLEAAEPSRTRRQLRSGIYRHHALDDAPARPALRGDVSLKQRS